ncbi:hypothetical protein HYU16_05235 [Candidatus Woesearchaeota archaeon]|nr:hypothetical protein [Candidatus Woesearchaeota archaeon]
MISYVLFGEKGSAKKGSTLDYPKPGKKDYLLIFLSRPGREEIDKVAYDFKFDKKPINNFAKEFHSRRFITVPFQFVMRSVFLENGKVDFTNLLFVLTPQCLIVASSKESRYYDELVDNLFEEFRKTKVRSIGHILCNFLQEDVDENYEVLGKIEEQIKNIEFKAALFETESRVKVEDIMYLKSQLYKLSRQFWATTRVISLIRMGVAQVSIDTESIRLLGDVHETFLHQIDVAAAQKEMLSDTLTVYATGVNNRLAIISNDLNMVMKRLAAYGLILLIPTLISGIFGMNFSVIPFAQYDWGFYAVTGSTLALMAAIFFYAKKNDWL